MTGPRDMKPWEVYAYSRYRANLRYAHTRPQKPVKAARIERPYLWLLWTAHGIAWTAGRIQQQREYRAKTTLKAPEGVFFNAEKED